MPDLTPRDAILLISLLLVLLALYRLSLRLEMACLKRQRDRARNARQEHLDRLARMHTFSRRAAQPLPGRMPPPAAIHSSDQIGRPTTHAYRGWTPPPANLTTEITPMRGIGDSFDSTTDSFLIEDTPSPTDGGSFAGAGASGSWDTRSSDSPSPATQD